MVRHALSLRVILAALFTLALALRLWGIGFGLPYLYHPDEPAHVLQALAVAREAEVIAEFRPDVGEGELPFVYDRIYAPFTDLARLERPGPTIKVFYISAARIGQ